MQKKIRRSLVFSSYFVITPSKKPYEKFMIKFVVLNLVCYLIYIYIYVNF